MSNIFAMIACTIFLLSGFTNMRIGDFFSGYFLEIVGILCLFTWFFNLLGKTQIAITYLFVLISTAIFYFDSYSGINSGTYLYYFPLLLAIANIFNFQTKQDRIRMISHLVFIVTLVFVNLFSGHRLFVNLSMTENQRQMMFVFNMAFSVICMGYFIYLIVNTNVQKVNLLKNFIAEESKLRAVEEEKYRDKEIFLAELQHRIKNNLSLMSSLLKLKLEDITEKNYELAFKESIHAIQTVAQANHFQIIEDGKMIIPVNIYLNEVNIYWAQLMSENPILGAINMSCDDFYLNIKQGIPVGLIFHELITMFWFYSLENGANEHVNIQISDNKTFTYIKVNSTIPDLLKFLPAKETIFSALVDQLDGIITQKSPFDFEVKITNSNFPMLESESLFK